MGWLDKPTKEQINALYYWMKWELPTSEIKDALDWLEENATRKQVADEMTRVRGLYHAKRLNRIECFKGDIWQEYFNSKVGKE